jgi:agmatine/peptidylarginine deiminase
MGLNSFRAKPFRASTAARTSRIAAVGVLFWAAAALVLAPQGARADSPFVDLRHPVTDPPEENSLPIGMTPEELTRRHEIGHYTRDTAPPPGPGIRQCAEWEPVTGALVRYTFGLPYAVMREIAEDIELWVLVASSSQQTSAYNALNSNGVNMANVRFIIASTDSYWTRDYGPQFAFDANGDQGIIDHHYNRPRPLDDLANYACGTAWSVPVYGSPLIHTGGNYMCDGHGNGHSTDLVYDENTIPDSQVDAYMLSYLGITDYRVVPDIMLNGIHHIDCWAKLLDEETILVKQVAPSNPNYTRIENNVATMQTWTNCYGRPYKIARVYCQTYSGDVAAYTNSIILNNKVLMPTFGNSTYDNQALQSYRDAMPGYEVLGFSGSWLTDDAIHCRAMGIHDKYMLRIDCAPVPDTVETAGLVRVGAIVDDRSEAGLKADSVRVYWRVAGAPAFESVAMTAGAVADSFYAYLPGQSPGTSVEYYVFAADNTNRRETRPIPAPAGWFSYVVGSDPEAVGEPDASGGLATRPSPIELFPAWPNPMRGSTTVQYRLNAAGAVRVSVADVSGREVAVLVSAPQAAGGHSARWDGRDGAGRDVGNGIYFVRVAAGGIEVTGRVVVIE